MVASRLASSNWRADRLTPTGTRLMPSCSHARCWRQASRSTHAPIGTIRPVSSAMGMNLSGGTRLPSGWGQRIRASMPISSPERVSTWGW